MINPPLSKHPHLSQPLTRGEVLRQKTTLAQSKAKIHQQVIIRPSLLRTFAVFISPVPEYLAERQGLGFSCLSQAVAQLSRTCAAHTRGPGDTVL